MGWLVTSKLIVDIDRASSFHLQASGASRSLTMMVNHWIMELTLWRLLVSFKGRVNDSFVLIETIFTLKMADLGVG